MKTHTFHKAMRFMGFSGKTETGRTWSHSRTVTTTPITITLQMENLYVFVLSYLLMHILSADSVCRFVRDWFCVGTWLKKKQFLKKGKVFPPSLKRQDLGTRAHNHVSLPHQNLALSSERHKHHQNWRSRLDSLGKDRERLCPFSRHRSSRPLGSPRNRVNRCETYGRDES